MTKKIQCPVCTETVIWSEQSPWRPFCSERCKLIDLGDWAAEKHVIAGHPAEASGVDLDAVHDGTQGQTPKL